MLSTLGYCVTLHIFQRALMDLSAHFETVQDGVQFFENSDKTHVYVRPEDNQQIFVRGHNSEPRSQRKTREKVRTTFSILKKKPPNLNIRNNASLGLEESKLTLSQFVILLGAKKTQVQNNLKEYMKLVRDNIFNLKH